MKKLILTSEKTSSKSLSSLYIYRNAFTKLFLLAFCFIGASMLAKGQYDTLDAGFEKIVKIDSISVESPQFLFLGDTINIEVQYSSIIQGEATIALMRNGGVHIIGEDTTLKGNFEKITLDTNIIYTKSYKVVVDTIADANIEVVIKYHKLLPGYSDFDRGPVVIIGKPDPCALYVTIAGSAGSGSSCTPENVDQIDNQCKTYNFIPPPYCASPQLDTSRIVHISGNVAFNDWNEPARTDEVGNLQIRKKSPYTEVWLFFREVVPCFIGNSLYHPKEYGVNGPIEHVHFAKCDDNGNFFFDFHFDSLQLKCLDSTKKYEAVLFVAKENEALWLESPTNHWKILGPYNSYRQPNPAHIRIFTISPGVIKSDKDFNFIGLHNFELDAFDGSVFRHTTLSRRFMQDRYSLTDEQFSNFGLYQLHVIRKNNSDPFFWHSPDNHFVINNLDNCGSRIVSHEYGHYIDYVLMQQGFGPILEGWATFYSWIYRAWVNNKYNDYIDTLIDNCELGPFCSYTNIDQYDNITKHGERFGNINKEIPDARFACFLWNIYDGISTDNFQYFSYKGRDNDDIHGLEISILDHYLESLGTTIPLTFKNNFISNYTNSDPLLAESIDSLYNFMHFDMGDSDVEVDDLHINMKSPNLDFTYEFTNGEVVTLDWSQTNSYNHSIPDDMIIKGAKITTTYHFANYNNKENGVRYYLKEGEEDWSGPINILNYEENNSFQFNYLDNIVYKFATYNTFGGNSYKPWLSSILGKFPVIDTTINFNNEIPVFSLNNYNLKISLYYEAHIYIDLFSIDGKMYERIYDGIMKKGMHSIDLYNSISCYNPGVYLIRIISISQNNVLKVENFKILNLR